MKNNKYQYKMNSSIENHIKTPLELNDKIVIYGADACKYCDKSKELLDTNHIEYLYYNLNDYYGKDKRSVYLNHLKQNKLLPVYHNTIPIVYIDKKFVGGFTELETYINNNIHMTEDF